MSIHKPVLLKETIELLNLKTDSVVVDATLGGGGHARSILKKIGNSGKLIAIDLDGEAIKRFIAEFQISNFKFQNNFQNSKFKIKNSGNIFLVQGNFSELKEILNEIGIRKVDAILADLGWSSDQLEGKGMSFMKDEELDMRLSLQTAKLAKYENTNGIPSAKDIVNNYSEEDLGKIIREYGEERFWKNIARKIIAYRADKKIETTAELAEIIKNSIPPKFRSAGWRRKIHPATKTFQAFRIAVNRELDNLKIFIPQAMEALAPEGRLAVISFHSLEDRIVKNSFRENARGCICPPDFPCCVCGKIPLVKIITRKPVVAEDGEICDNPRARSAKLRVCEKM